MSVQAASLLTFSHFGVAVESIDAFKQTWGALFGIEEWSEADAELPGDMVEVYGEVQPPIRSRVAFAKFAGIAIELIQPVVGRPHAAHYLEAHGEGLHHIAFWVPDLLTEIDKLEPDMFEVVYAPKSVGRKDAGEPIGAVVSGDMPSLPPYFSYIERTGARTLTVELLDAKYVDRYRCLYGDGVLYPE